LRVAKKRKEPILRFSFGSPEKNSVALFLVQYKRGSLYDKIIAPRLCGGRPISRATFSWNRGPIVNNLLEKLGDLFTVKDNDIVCVCPYEEAARIYSLLPQSPRCCQRIEG
jgi:hypothetical protein